MQKDGNGYWQAILAVLALIYTLRRIKPACRRLVCYINLSVEICGTHYPGSCPHEPKEDFVTLSVVREDTNHGDGDGTRTTEIGKDFLCHWFVKTRTTEIVLHYQGHSWQGHYPGWCPSPTERGFYQWFVRIRTTEMKRKKRFSSLFFIQSIHCKSALLRELSNLLYKKYKENCCCTLYL